MNIRISFVNVFFLSIILLMSITCGKKESSPPGGVVGESSTEKMPSQLGSEALTATTEEGEDEESQEMAADCPEDRMTGRDWDGDGIDDGCDKDRRPLPCADVLDDTIQGLTDMKFDHEENLLMFIKGRILKYNLQTQQVVRIAGGGQKQPGPAVQALRSDLSSEWISAGAGYKTIHKMHMDSKGNIYLPKVKSGQTYKIDAQNGLIDVWGGGGNILLRDAPDGTHLKALKDFDPYYFYISPEDKMFFKNKVWDKDKGDIFEIDANKQIKRVVGVRETALTPTVPQFEVGRKANETHPTYSRDMFFYKGTLYFINDQRRHTRSRQILRLVDGYVDAASPNLITTVPWPQTGWLLHQGDDLYYGTHADPMGDWHRRAERAIRHIDLKTMSPAKATVTDRAGKCYGCAHASLDPKDARALIMTQLWHSRNPLPYAVDKDGSIYIFDSTQGRLIKVDKDTNFAIVLFKSKFPEPLSSERDICLDLD